MNGPEVIIDMPSILEQAKRQRLVANSLADLHFVNTVFEEELLPTSDVCPEFPEGRELAYSFAGYLLRPTFDSHNLTDATYTGFRVEETVPSGGATHTITYDQSAADPKINLFYKEYTEANKGFLILDDDEIEANYSLQGISRSPYTSQLFAERSTAAYDAACLGLEQQKRHQNESRKLRHMMKNWTLSKR